MGNNKIKRFLAVVLSAMMLLACVSGIAEDAATADAEETAVAATEETANTGAEETANADTDETATAPAETANTAANTAIVDTQRLDASYTLALNAINKEDYTTAKEYLDICFAYCDPLSNPVMYADLLLKRACINVIEEKYDMALLNLDAALRVQPDLADAYLVRTQIYTTNADFENAVANLEKYIELTEDAAMYATVAQLHEANGNTAAAEEAYDKYAAVAGENDQEAGFQAGLYKMENGKLEEAIEAFKAYENDATYGAGAQYNIGVCKMNMGDYAGAIEAFDACEKKGGEFEGLWYNRGTCYFLSENWEKSAADFSTSIEKKQFADDARYNLAICKMQQEDYKEAINVFSQLIKSAEGQEDVVLNDAVYYFRAVCYSALEKYEEAIQDLTTCIDHGYELSQTYYERAQVYAAMGDTEKQSQDLESSLKNTK